MLAQRWVGVSVYLGAIGVPSVFNNSMVFGAFSSRGDRVVASSMFPHPRRWSSSFGGAVRRVATSQIERNRRVSGARMAWVRRLLARARNCIPSTHSIISASTTFRLALATDVLCCLPNERNRNLFCCGYHPPGSPSGCRVDYKLAPCSGHASLRCVAAPAHGTTLDLSGPDRNVRGGWGNAPHPSALSICRYIYHERLARSSRLFWGCMSPQGSVRARRRREGNATWLILPVVICLSQRLSHACVSMN